MRKIPGRIGHLHVELISNGWQEPMAHGEVCSFASPCPSLRRDATSSA